MASRSQPSRTPSILRPGVLAMALEPRILFDGAAASAVEQQHASDTGAAAAAASHNTATEPPGNAAPAPGRNLVVIDSRVEQVDTLLRNLDSGSRALVIGEGDNALAKISSALAEMGQATSVQILSHGAAGQFELGDRSYSSETLRQAATTLQGWRANLAAGADIELYGCNVGAGESGRALVQEIARSTGADVAASSDDTGSTSRGGNWTLEVRQGTIESALAINAAGVAQYDALLANASPTVSFAQPGSDVLLGDQFTFTVTLANGSGQVGYGPFVDLILPNTGKDGDDGVGFVAATYLGQNLVAHTVTFDAAGNATHPIAKDINGNPLVINAATYGMRPGDTLVVVELPYASLSNQQPAISFQVTATLSDLADTTLSNGSPDLTIKARGGFEFGNDAYNNPTADPSLVEAGTHDFVVHPTLISLTQSIDMREGETASGPNYVHSQTVTVTPGPGQTLNNVVVTQDLPGTIQVTAITPGSGGTLTSVTLTDGRVLTGPVAINAAIASDTLFIASYTITYATLSGPTDQVVSFYVPESSAAGTPVLDPVSGNDVTINLAAPSATGSWTPLDPRDVTPPDTSIDFSGTGTGLNGSFTVKSITLEKTATLQTDTGASGLTPGDTLRYTLEVALSDYFAFGQTLFRQGHFTVTDTLGDGQTLSGTPSLSFTAAGVTHSVALVYVSSTNANGETTITFDIAATLLTLPDRLIGALAGDLADDTVQQGATKAVISYEAVVGQAYTSSYTQSEINEGDPLGNSAVLDATLLSDRVNLTGDNETDTSNSSVSVPTHTVDISVLAVNGGTPPSNGEVSPGDTVSFSLSYDLATGDYEQLKLTVYMPDPLFNLGALGTLWTNGTGVNQWTLGSGNTSAGPVASVTTVAGNALQFDFGSYVTPATTGSRIEITFTLRVGDQPFADQRAESVLAQSSQFTTIDHRELLSSDVAVIASVAEPVLDIRHGVVSSSHGTTDVTGWAAPGTSGQPFPGSVTDLTTLDGNVTGIDAGDLLRLATAIKNSGGDGAFDLSTDITLPAGLAFVGGSLANANLLVYRGDGTLLALGTDYSIAGNTITFLDAGGIASLHPGRAGTAADTSGNNVVVITYDTVVSSSMEASSSLQSSASLTRYASVDGGANFLSAPVSDKAQEQVAAPDIRKTFADGSLDGSDSSASHTTGSDLVVGESMLYDIIVTLPEGTTRTLSIDDLIPAGMRLDTSFNGNQAYQLITTAGGALAANYGGTVSVSVAAASGVLGNDGVDARFTFTANATAADNVTNNNSFVIRVRLVADNVSGNQAGRSLQNDARLSYVDPDGDTPNGSTPLARDLALTGGKPTVTLREPTLQISQTLVTDPGIGFDEGDPIEFTVSLRNGNASSDFAAFDLLLQDALPTQLSGFAIAGITYSGGATNNGGGDFEVALVGSQYVLRTVSGANIDIAKGGSIVVRLTATVNANAASVPQFDNTAEVRWTSLDGSSNTSADPAGERTGSDGLLNSGVLNDYAARSTLVIPVAQGIKISRVGGLADTAAPDPTNAAEETVAIGELVHYRAVVLVPKGNNPNYEIRITLDNGLTLADIASMRIGLVSDGGLTSDIALTTSGQLVYVGNQDSPQAQYLTSDLSGAAVSGVLNPSLVAVSTDGNGVQTVTITLGNVTNGGVDAIDNDQEGVVVEFNARVTNQASNQAGSRPGVSVTDRVNGADRATSDTLYERVVEPGFNGINKQVIDFDPNPASSSGSATLALSFTQNGGLPAYDVSLSDSVTGGSNYSFVAVEINGVRYTDAASVPARFGFSLSTSGGIAAGFARINPGDAVKLIYSVTVPNTAAIASSDATLAWSSLPETFTQWGGSTVGTDGGSQGERTGADGGGGLNDYVLKEGAGLGIISGTLWNDTASATSSATPDGPGIGGQTVTLTWAGLDGDLASTADNKTFTSVTDASGNYHFGVLAAGAYQVSVGNTIVLAQPIGTVQSRIDSDGGSLGQIAVSLGEGASGTASTGYVEQNDAPQNQLPVAPFSGNEDTQIALTGISITDVDAERDPVTGDRDLQIVLTVQHGTLSLASTPPGVTVSTQNLATLTLQGRLADLNLALGQLRYQGVANFNGADALSMVTSDLGNFGDANGDGIPGQPADALTDSDKHLIVVVPVNDPPVANNDSATAVEAGGRANGTPGVDPLVYLLTNDTDVDTDPTLNARVDQLRVISAGLQAGPQTSIAEGDAVQITGLYGTLVVASGGGAVYVVDNDNPTVQALRTSGNTLNEVFSYTISDLAGANSTATFTVTIQGANDAPVAGDDAASATEAGGIANGSPGADATGNALTNDSDVDSGDSRSVTRVRLGDDQHYDGAVSVPASSTSANGASVTGLYGTLYIGADGSYRYVVDDSNTAVQGLSPLQTLQEVFSYELTDLAGAHDAAQITITINGAADNPVASDDLAQAQAAATNNSALESNPSGNVILYPSRPGPTDNGIDTDVDFDDQSPGALQVSGIRNGTEPSGGALSGVTSAGVDIDASYATLNGSPVSSVDTFGRLTIKADGSFHFDVNSDNPDIQALNAGQTLAVVFTYQVTDSAGKTDLAQLVIEVHGVNDPPLAHNGVAVATERGGVANASPGVDPSGNVLVSATDPDSDPLSVIAIRTGPEAGSGTAGTVGTPLAGLYGTLTLQADGTYTYVVNNNLDAVQALRGSSNILVERFTYTVSDNVVPTPETDTAELVVVIRGQNDNPVAGDDGGTAVEAGGSQNNQPGQNASGNVLANDTDPDGGEVPADLPQYDYGETQAVVSVRTGTELGSGTTGTLGTELRGTYGWLVLNADGSYTYRVDDAMGAVQGLRTSADTLTDSFSYEVGDKAGARDRATLNITIRGANDTPQAASDTAVAIEAGGVSNGTPGVDPSGNVLSNDTDVDTGDTLTVTGVSRNGNAGRIDQRFATAYGSLLLRSDGSYSYLLDNDNPLVQSLRTNGNSLTETFNYTIRDLDGATGTATLTIIVRGRNDTPQAHGIAAFALEAGGTANATPGLDPAGNLLENDTDVDGGDSKTIDGVRTGAIVDTGNFSVVTNQHVINGRFGTLVVFADGRFSYVLDNSLAAVQALRPGDSLVDPFTYEMRDAAGATSVAELRVTVQGAWDAPVAGDNIGYAVTASETSAGSDATGNVITGIQLQPADSDVDHGDVLSVTGIRTGPEASAGAFDNVTANTDSSDGTLLTGTYGDLIIGSDGSYIYRPDASNPILQALGPLQFVTETFTYRLGDLGGLGDLAQLSIVVRGLNSAPVAANDTGLAVEAGGTHNDQPGTDPSGNVLANDQDIESDALSVVGVRVGPEQLNGASGTLGTALRGHYGELTLNADGSWTYLLDNTLPAVEALRQSGQTLTDLFTYTVADVHGATDEAVLRITIDGRDDAPTGVDDDATAIEAGGIRNAIPGQNPTGNVLVNDVDVDSAANGESLSVVSVTNPAGEHAAAGNALQGRYGQLTLNADGSYLYTLDNDNPAVQALRTAGETLRESFTYVLRDAAGATGSARLNLLIQGANDNPVAVDDHAPATDATPAPQGNGNVLTNDTDVDAGESRTVVAIRTGREADGGTAGTVGQALAGRYGTLLIAADGSYHYEIDLSNPEVLAAAGFGPVLHDVFTYTAADKAGAVDAAELVIDLDIAAPYIPPGDSDPHWSDEPRNPSLGGYLPAVDPGLFVTPEVSRDAIVQHVSGLETDGSKIGWLLDRDIHAESLGAGLGAVEGQFVGRAVKFSQLESELDLAQLLGRESRMNLSADGLLPSPSLFPSLPEHMLHGFTGPSGEPSEDRDAQTAEAFSTQLQAAARRRLLVPDAGGKPSP